MLRYEYTFIYHHRASLHSRPFGKERLYSDNSRLIRWSRDSGCELNKTFPFVDYKSLSSVWSSLEERQNLWVSKSETQSSIWICDKAFKAVLYSGLRAINAHDCPHTTHFSVFLSPPPSHHISLSSLSFKQNSHSPIQQQHTDTHKRVRARTHACTHTHIIIRARACAHTYTCTHTHARRPLR